MHALPQFHTKFQDLDGTIGVGCGILNENIFIHFFIRKLYRIQKIEYGACSHRSSSYKSYLLKTPNSTYENNFP